MVGVGDRVRTYLRDREIGTSHRLDHYLTEHLPRLAREHELATQHLIRPIDEQLERHRENVADAETWRGASVQRLELIKKRIGRLELRSGAGLR